MKYFYVMLFLLVFVCCDKEEVLDINSLKDSGYTEILCKDIDEYENQDTRFIEFNKKFLNKKSFLVARCFDENNCLITMSIDKDKVICQRYFVDKSEEDKRDYLNGSYKEYVVHRIHYLSVEYDNHSVLYLSVDEDSAKEFIKKGN